MLGVDKNPVVVAWIERGLDLSKRDKEHRWALADWLADGDEKWGGRAYDEAQRIFPDLSRKYLQQTAYVGRHVKLPVRQENLSFTHHEVVAPLEPAAQVRWLAEALKPPKMSATALRKAIANERMTESPFAVPLPFEVFRRLDDLATKIGQTKEALVIAAVSGLLEKSAEDVLAQQKQDQQDIDARREKDRIREIARSKADAEWSRTVRAGRAAYVRENPEPVFDSSPFDKEGESLNRKLKALDKRLEKAQGGDLIQKLADLRARRAVELEEVRKRRDDAKNEHEVAVNEWRREASRRFPWEPPDKHLYRAQVAARVAKELAVEAEKLAQKAEWDALPDEPLFAQTSEVTCA